MEVEEIEYRGTKYRGPLPSNSPSAPWKITVLRLSMKIGTSGQGVGLSWQTYKNFPTEEAAREEMKFLKHSGGV